MTQPTIPLWLLLSLALALVVFIATLGLGWDRSYWYDEVFTLGYAGVGRPIDWPLLKSDVHPPTYALMVRVMAQTLGLDPTGFALRLANLPALFAVAWAFWLLREVMDLRRRMLLACLLLVNFYTLMLGLDLRSYALMLGFGLLAHVLFLREVSGLPPRHIPLMLTCALLSSLHFFGAAIGLSILAFSAYLGWHRGMSLGVVLARVILAGLLTSGVLAWVLVYSETLAATGGNNWIRFGPDPWLDFIGWQGLAMLVALLSLVLRRSGHGRPIPRPAKQMLLPAALVLAVTLAISLHSPVISGRNLTVLVPPVLLFIVMAVPGSLFTENLGLGKAGARGLGIAGGVAVLLVALIGARLLDSTTRNGQMIRWVLAEALLPACEGAPIFVKRPDQLDEVAQTALTGRVQRPPLNYPLYDPALIPADCPVLGMGWHELGPVSDVVDFMTERGEAVEAVLPPDPRLAAQGLQTSGYVIIRKP
ncbi:MAG: hypothetical protein AAGF22_07780 [Pseudomonadota bacterium]